MGGRRASQSIDGSLADKDLNDDILGGGSFVERVLDETPHEEKTERSLDEIMKIVADYYKLNFEELSWPGKVRSITTAKAVICFLATRQYRIQGSIVGKRLGYSASAVSRFAQRGHKIFEEDEGLRNLLG